MLVVGLTGGIGSGKSTIAHFFEILGIPVYYADTKAKELINNHKELKEKLINLFGELAYIDGKYNTNFISKQVFADKEKLEKLNKIIHPAVLNDFENWKNIQKSKYVIKEAAILFESGTYKTCNKIITVTATLDEKIKRVMKRDQVTKEEVIQRINKQINDEEKISKSDFVIYNNNTELLIPNIIKIHESIISSSN